MPAPDEVGGFERARCRATFALDRHVAEAEPAVEVAGDRLEEGIAIVFGAHDEVSGQRRARSAFRSRRGSDWTEPFRSLQAHRRQARCP